MLPSVSLNLKSPFSCHFWYLPRSSVSSWVSLDSCSNSAAQRAEVGRGFLLLRLLTWVPGFCVLHFPHLCLSFSFFPLCSCLGNFVHSLYSDRVGVTPGLSSSCTHGPLARLSQLHCERWGTGWAGAARRRALCPSCCRFRDLSGSTPRGCVVDTIPWTEEPRPVW